MTDNATPFSILASLFSAEVALLWSSFAELLPAFVIVLFVGHTLLIATLTTTAAKEQPNRQHESSIMAGDRTCVDASKKLPIESYKKKPLGDKTNATAKTKCESTVTKPTAAAAADVIDSPLISTPTPKESSQSATIDHTEPPPILSVVTTDTAASTVVVSPPRSYYTDTVTWTRNVQHIAAVESPRCSGYTDTVTWTRNIQSIKDKLELVTDNAGVRSILNPEGTTTETTMTLDRNKGAPRSPEAERKIPRALGDILIERIRQENPTLQLTVSPAEWETLLLSPTPVLAEILQQLEEHLERCDRAANNGVAILEWEVRQINKCSG